MAFPISYFAQASVYPWIPTLTQSVVITVSDTSRGLVGGAGGSVLRSVQSSISGNTIAIAARLEASPTDSDVAFFPVDVGVLPPGRYTVQYSSDGAGPAGSHSASLAFSVSADGLSAAVEFFNASLGHYFITANPNEIALLDKGTITGWSRTGESFAVMYGAISPTTAIPVCRFYGLPSAGIDSHFFSASPAECATVKARWPTQWLLETPNAFGIAHIDRGVCPGDSRALYRLYNNRPDANHRYTTSTSTRDLMLAKGWILEGTAPNNTSTDLVAMCVPV